MTDRQKRVLAAIAAIEVASPTNEITPRSLWEAARDEDHPLHDEFEWDDSKAADSWRDEQARRLLRLRVTVTVEERAIHAPICVRTPSAPAGQSGYTRTITLVNDRERSRLVFLEELDRAARAIQRARDIASAFGLSDECDALLARMTELRTQSASHAA